MRHGCPDDLAWLGGGLCGRYLKVDRKPSAVRQGCIFGQLYGTCGGDRFAFTPVNAAVIGLQATSSNLPS